MLIGIIMVPVSFVLLFINEGNAIKVDRDLSEGARAAVHIKDPSHVDAGNEGKLVHVTARADADETLKDSQFGISEKALRLDRVVEMYQWMEKQEEQTEGQGNQRRTVTKYSYYKGWSPQVISSTNFHEGGAHNNPFNMSVGGQFVSSESFAAKEVHLAGYLLPHELVGMIGGSTEAPLDEAALAKVREGLRQQLNLRQGHFYYSRSPASGGEEIGDIRISFRVTRPATISVLARQAKNSFQSYATSGGTQIYALEMGERSSDDMVSTLKTQNTVILWVLRGVGFMLMLFGIMLCFQPIMAVADFIPFLGEMVNGGIFLFGLAMSFFLTLCTISVAWLTYRPIVGVPLLLAAIAGTYGLRRLIVARGGDESPTRRRKKRRRDRDREENDDNDEEIPQARSAESEGGLVVPRAPRPASTEQITPAAESKPAPQLPPGMVQIRCPNCEAPYTVPEKVLGKKTTCKKCQVQFVIDEDIGLEVVEEGGLELVEEEDPAAPAGSSTRETPPPALQPDEAPRRKRRKKQEWSGRSRGSGWFRQNRTLVRVLSLVAVPIIFAMVCCGGTIWSLIPFGGKSTESVSAAALNQPDLDEKDVVGLYLLEKNQKCLLVVAPGGDIRVRDPDRIWNGGAENKYTIHGHTISTSFGIDPVINGESFGSKAVLEVKDDKLIHPTVGAFVRQPSPWAAANAPQQPLADLQGNGPLGTASFIVLGPMNGQPLRGLAISADGSTVVGESPMPNRGLPRPFRWTKERGVIDLGWPEEGLPGSGSARGVSANGSMAAGDAYLSATTNGEAVLFSSLGSLNLHAPEERSSNGPGFTIKLTGQRRSTASAISVDGSILAGFALINSAPQAFRWTKDSGATLLEKLPDAPVGAMAQPHGISGDGAIIVGEAVGAQPPGQHPSNAVHAVRWTKDGGVNGLSAAADYADFVPRVAEAISSDGTTVVGFGTRVDSPLGTRIAFRWTDSANAVPLDDLPDGSDTYVAQTVSGDGTVIAGWSSTPATGKRATVWETKTGVHDLQVALQRDYGLGLGEWKLQMVRGVSAYGRTLMGTVVAANDVGLGDSDVAVKTWVLTLNPTGETLFSKETFKAKQYPGAKPPDQLVKTSLPDLEIPGVESKRWLAFQLSWDGRIFALADPDGGVHVWQVNPSKELATFKSGQSVNKLAFSPDGKLLAMFGSEPRPDWVSRMQIWDWQAGKKIEWKERTAGGAFNDVSFSPDGKMLATADSAGNVIAADLFTGKGVSARDPRTTAVAFSGDGSFVVAAGGQTRIRVMHMNGDIRDIVIGGIASFLTVSKDGKTLAWCQGSRVNISDIKDGWDVVTTASFTPSSAISSLTFSPDDRILAAASIDGSVGLYDTATGKPFAISAEVLGAGDNQVCFLSKDKIQVAFHQQGSAGKTRSVKIWTADIPVERLSPKKAATPPTSPRPPEAASRPDVKVVRNQPEKVHLPDLALIGEFGRDLNAIGHSFEISPDGRRLAAASPRGDVKVWEVNSGRDLAIFATKLKFVKHTAFSPDGRLLVTCGEPAADPKGLFAARVWDCQSGIEVTSLEEYPKIVTQAAFSPDGKTLATLDTLGSVTLRETATWKPTVILDVRPRGTAMAFSPDGSLLAVAVDEGRPLQLIDVRIGRIVRQIAGPKWTLMGPLGFSRDGKSLAALEEQHITATNFNGKQYRMTFWDVATGKQYSAGFHLGAGSTSSLAFSLDGNVVAIASLTGAVYFYDRAALTADGIDVSRFASTGVGFYDRIVTGRTNLVTFLPDGRALLAFDDSTSGLRSIKLMMVNNPSEFLEEAKRKLLQVKKAETGPPMESAAPVKPAPTETTAPRSSTTSKAEGTESGAANVRKLPPPLLLKGHSNTPRSLAFTPNGKTLATAGADGDVKVWEVATGKEQAAFRRSAFVIRGIAISPDGRRVAASGGDHLVLDQPGAIRILDVESGQQTTRLEGHQGLVNCVAFSPDGRMLASGCAHSSDSSVKLWDVATWKEVHDLRDVPSIRISSLAFAPGGSSLAVGCDSGTIQLWDIATAKEKARFKGTAGSILSLAFSADGKTLAAGNFRDSTVSLWDLATGQTIGTLKGHKKNIVSLAFSPDGKLLVSGSIDGTVRLWDPATSKSLGTLAHDPSWTTIAFPTDDNKILIATGINDGTVKLWRVAQ
jgi:WD40 repeat protein